VGARLHAWDPSQPVDKPRVAAEGPIIHFVSENYDPSVCILGSTKNDSSRNTGRFILVEVVDIVIEHPIKELHQSMTTS
jgi:hypothetical protein